MNLTTKILAVIVGILYPIFIALSNKKCIDKISKNQKYRLVDYAQTILIFWIITILILVNYIVFKQPNLDFFPKHTLLDILLIISVIVFTLFQYKSSKISADDFFTVKEKLKYIYYYLPKNRIELNWFIFLSVSAGICEEIFFRLFLFKFIEDYSNILIAIIIANFIFAITHIGSGKANLFYSFILGLIFSTIFVFTNNIWIAVLLHISIDINVGTLGFRLNYLLQNS